MTNTEFWSRVRIDRELQPFLQLLPEEIPELMLKIKRSRSPVTEMTQLLTERARANRESLLEDIAQHQRRLTDPYRWGGSLSLIPQPWMKGLMGHQGAFIFPDAPLTVRHKSNGEPDTTFSSTKELLLIWRPDYAIALACHRGAAGAMASCSIQKDRRESWKR